MGSVLGVVAVGGWLFCELLACRVGGAGLRVCLND